MIRILNQKRFNVQDFRPQGKVKKAFKGYFKTHMGGSLENTIVNTDFGLVAEQGGRLKDTHFDNARTVIRRVLKPFKSASFTIRTMPDTPVTSKGPEARMGKGKGAIDYWAVWVAPDQILIEVEGVSKEIAHRALACAGHVFPVKTSIKPGNKDGKTYIVLPHVIQKRIEMHQALLRIKEYNRKLELKPLKNKK